MLNEIRNWLATASENECKEIIAASRERLTALRAADPYVYVLERTAYDETFVKHNGRVQYSTSHRGNYGWLAKDVQYSGGIEAALREDDTNPGAQGFGVLNVYRSRAQAEFVLEHLKRREAGYSFARSYAIRSVDKKSGKLVQED